MDAVLGAIGVFWGYTWWLWICMLMIPIASDAWIAWRQKKYEHEIKWSFLEILIPREVTKSPQAMEQVLNQIFHLKNWPGDIKEYWWDGEVTLWYSFELVSLGGEIHLYMRVPKVYRDLIEAAFFAFYPDIEIVETEDYMKRYAPTVQELYRDGMTLWGSELELAKSGAYPLKSYVDFESPDEDKQYDPISAFTELMAKIQPGQMTAIQYLCAPVFGPHDEHTVKGYEKEVIKLRERKHEVDSHAGPSVANKASFPGGFMPALELARHEADPEELGIIKKAVLSRTPGETRTIEAIEENLARPFFNVIIRYIYISPTETYSGHFGRRALWGAFNQFGDTDLNQLKRNKLTQTRGKIWEWPIIFPKIRYEYRRQKIYHDFRHREIPPHTFFGHLLMSDTWGTLGKNRAHKFHWGSNFQHLNTRSLATLFHPPTAMVLTGPHIKRVDSRKGGPPSGMAIFGDEKEIDKFK